MIKKVTVTDDEISKAREFSDIYKQNNYGKNVLGVTDEEFIHFIFIGKLAELAVKRFFEDANVEILTDEMLIPCENEHRVGADITLKYSQQEIDVKVAHLEFHKRLLVREDQFRAHIHDIYIGAKCTDNRNVYIHGYIKGAELAKKPISNFGYFDCRAEWLNQLKPIDDLVLKAKNGIII